MSSLLAIAVVLVAIPATALASEPVGKVRYTALSDAARKAGRLARYEKCPVTTGKASLGGHEISFSVPKTARAYDVVPIRYTLSQPSSKRRVAIETTAFEDTRRTQGRPLYDMAIPGDMGVKIEYLGSVCADFDQSSYIPLTADPKTPVSPFPPFKRDPEVLSSNIRQADAAWFKFRITNTGDTILDPEGFGAVLTEPRLIKIGADGKEEWAAGTVNQYDRFTQYLYPGDSTEMWVNFFASRFGPKCRGLMEGDYRLDFILRYRYHRAFDWWVNIWSGKGFARLEVPIKVTSTGGEAPVESSFSVIDTDEKMPGHFEAFEEFMTSFHIHEPADKQTRREGVIYVQVAPWTKDVAVKLILTDPKAITVTRVPIKVTGETLAIKHNPNNVMVVRDGGKEKPAIIAQEMEAMRAGFQLSPYTEDNMRARIRELKSLGVNVIANTTGGWWTHEIAGRTGVELHSACYKYFYDVLVREAGMKVLGWSVYPPSGAPWFDHAKPLLGREIKYSTVQGGYTGPVPHVDLGDPAVPEVIAAWTRYQYDRWGDTWFVTKDGRVPVDIEDTWGWMRDDINLRHRLGPLGLAKLREWVKAKYGSIEKTNSAWGSKYASFDEIDPQADQGIEGDGIKGEPVYNKPDHVFHDWSPAVNDWDIFRTELRMQIYRKANEIMRKHIPGAELALRTEGANLTIKGDPKSDSMHWRHVYYSQRRNAMVQDVVAKANVLHFYSDYTTLPYSEEEWRQAMREMVASGIIPAFLPQFDHMRDILLNPHYGRSYQTHYGLDQPAKGMMVHCLMAAFPWWKITYEEGGAPGIIWSDHMCDGFATETQKREIKLLREQFDLMPAGTGKSQRGKP
jgi:hypothetical protein